MTELVATLIARPENGPDLAAAVAAAGELLKPAATAILAPNAATDLFFTADETPKALAAKLREAIAGRPVDIAVQPVAHRRKKLLLADMDSTIIGQECIDELAAHAGVKAMVAAITERAMRGEIEFEPALRERVATLAGLPETTVAQVIAERITLTPGARVLVATMRAAGAKTILVSGGFTAFTGSIANTVGFEENYANTLIIADGKLAGTVAEPILGREAKLARLEEAVARLGIAFADSIAVGDGANDLAMLGRAGLGVAYHAKPKVAEAADVRIEHTDLTALLYLQGYAQAAFAA